MRRFYTMAAIFLAAFLFLFSGQASACSFKASFKGDSLICTGSTGFYQTTRVSGHTYKWTLSGGGSISKTSTNKDSIQVLWATPGTWSVKIQDSAGGCIDSVRLKVKVGLTTAYLMASGFTTAGTGTVSGKTYSVTTSGSSQVGAVWNKTPINLNSNFDLSFDITQYNTAGSASNHPADGMMFVLQNTGLKALGTTTAGSDMGFYNAASGIFDQSLGIEFDIFNSGMSTYYDSTDSHIAIVKNKSPLPLRYPPTPTTSPLWSYSPSFKTFRLLWNATAKQLSVYYDGKRLFTQSIDPVSNIFSGNPNVYFGFTGQTGANTSTQSFIVDTLIIGKPIITAPSSTTVCQGDSITLSSSAGLKYVWSNGAKTRTVKIGKAGSYYVTVTDSFNCVSSSDAVTVTVNPKPTVKPGTSKNSCIGGSAIIGSLPATSGYQYSWSSKPYGFSSSKSQDTVKPTASTTYYLNVLDKSTGCSKTDSVKVTINPSPTSAFTATGSCPGTNITFNNTSTSATGGKLTYLWRFDDATTSSATTPVKSFTKPGFHNIWLIAKSDSGCLDSSTQKITINAVPALSYAASSGCLGQSTTFTNNSVFNGGSATYVWKFGDGNTSTATTPSRVYASAGTYKTWLVATTNKGCKDSLEQDLVVAAKPTASFTYTGACASDSIYYTNNSSTSTGTITSYTWNFGDGATATAKSPAHKFKAGYYVTWLAVKGSTGCTDTTWQGIKINATPKAIIGGQNTCLTLTTQFTDSSIAGAGSTIAARFWNFGDGSNSTLANPTHSYSSPAIYPVWLKVVSSTGCKDSVLRQITIYPIPDASFTATKQSKRNYNFVATDKTQSQYDWSFGDASTNGTGTSTSHNYAKDSTYSVSLKVTNSFGCNQTTSQSIKISTGIAPALSGDDIKMHLFPNPFDKQFTLNYTLAKPAKVRISVMDIQGREVALIAQGDQSFGEHNYIINAQDYNMKGGVYIVKLMIDGQAINKQMIQIK